VWGSGSPHCAALDAAGAAWSVDAGDGWLRLPVVARLRPVHLARMWHAARPLVRPALSAECHPVDLTSVRPRSGPWAALIATAAGLAKLCPRVAVW
jgi:hypothetical protein